MNDDQEYEGEDVELEDDGVLDPSETLEGGLGDDPLERAIDAPERWSAGQRYGTTLAEERTGESLDQLLDEEEPDADPYSVDQPEEGAYPESGALVADDDGTGQDEEPDLVARAVGGEGDTPAEEAAVHVVEESDRDTSPFRRGGR